MKDIHINFNSTEGVDFPDGTCLGVQGEHLATRLVIQLPYSMLGDYSYSLHFNIDSKEVHSPAISDVPNTDSAYVQDGIIYFPLSEEYTFGLMLCIRIVTLARVGNSASVMDSSPPIHGLYLLDTHGAPPDESLTDHYAEQIYRHLVKQGTYRVQKHSDLYKFPCNRASDGDYVEVIEDEVYPQDNSSTNLEPDRHYPILFFNPSPSFPFERIKMPGDEDFPLFGNFGSDAPKELLTFSRKNGDVCIVSLEYQQTLSSYAVVVRYLALKDDCPVLADMYYYCLCDGAVVVDDKQLTVNKGWNKLVTTAEGDTVFVRNVYPATITDVVCTGAVSDRPLSIGGGVIMRHLSRVICPLFSYEFTQPAGKYFYHAKGKTWFLSGSPRSVTIRFPERRTWYGTEITIPCPGITPDDSGVPMYEDDGEKFEIAATGYGWVTIREKEGQTISGHRYFLTCIFTRGRNAEDLMVRYREWKDAPQNL